MERPAAIERFIMELLADPEPPPVSRPKVLLYPVPVPVHVRYFKNVGGFLWALGSSFNRESMLII